MLARKYAERSPVKANCTVAGALRRGAARLSQAGIESARLDAEILLRQVLAFTREQFLMEFARPIGDAVAAQFEALLRRREAREPLAYITGEKEFWSLDFAVSPAVLIPRPETELLVELVLAEARRFAKQGSLRILDIGTGSGAIAVTLARHLTSAEVWACDISRAALDIAKQNAIRHGVGQRVRLVAGDLLAAIKPGVSRFDLVVSNPPYLSRAGLAAAAPEVRDWEPALALDGGSDGLDYYPKMIPDARKCLRDGGIIFLEIGSEQAQAVAGMIAQADGYLPASIHRDYAGRNRVAMARTGNARG
jgi:release factor glutamine methyltransferase